MAEPELVRDCVAAMQDAVDVPVTVKQRIGIDDQESYALLRDFVGTVAEGGTRVFIVHARKAWLSGLSPKENREVPPLNYDWVYQLKRDFPELTLILNGGLDSLDACHSALTQVDGVMLGRAPYQNPWLLAAVDSELFGECPVASHRDEVIAALLPYINRVMSRGSRLHHVTRHVLGLYQGQPGGRRFRRHLSELAHREGAGAEVLEAAAALCSQAATAKTERSRCAIEHTA